MTTYAIGKGDHVAHPRPLALHAGRTDAEWHWRASFGPGCNYEMEGPDRWDYNKLVGVSIGLHHRTSFRFGWRHVNDSIEVAPYVWYRGARLATDFTLCKTQVGMELDLYIQLDRRWVVFGAFCDERGDGRLVTREHSIRVDLGPLRWGYFLNPYFGGNQTAPNSMVISLERCR